MELPWLSYLPLITFTLSLLLSFSSTVESFKRCPNCGSTRVPYPLSTGLDCGDPDYKIRCDNRGSLWFDTLNGSTNPIKTINPSGQRLVLIPPGFEPNRCVSVDIKYHGIQLDPNLPFNVSSSNTVVIMNCTKEGLDAYTSQGFNCSDNSLCHKFLNVVNSEAQGKCRGVTSCCWYKTGASVNTYKVYRTREDMCSAYQSFMNLDLISPVSKWGEPAVEILWEAPREPVCKVQRDCTDLVNSVCLVDSMNLGQKRCFCKKGFRWDSVNALCEVKSRCYKGKKCKRGSNLPLIGGLTGGVGAILIAGYIMKTIISKQNQRVAGNKSWASVKKLHRHLLTTNNAGLDKIFTGKEIIKSTNNFAESNLLGFGGFGEVFKGNLEDGTEIAVKRAKIGNEKSIYQIVNEVQILCQVSHKNLVKLLGCCIDLDMPILVYEFVSNGTLYEHIYGGCGGGGGGRSLPWRRRLMIAHQTAQGLDYLHSSATPPIYHRDVKSSNILLDENLDVKVADFGLSRLGVSDVSHVTTCAQGTLGYLDPEYYLNFQLTDKSDVYSFGVVLFELLTCKKAIDFNRDEEDVNLVVFVRKALKEGRFVEMIDPVIRKGATVMEIESMKELGVLAELCVKETRQCRPTMKVVVKEIESILHGIAASEA